MIRVSATRTWRRVVIVAATGAALLLLLNSRSRNDHLDRLRQLYSADQLFALAEKASLWLPGGRRVDPSQLDRLAGSQFLPAMAVASSESRGTQLVFPHIADGLNEANDIRIVTSIVLVGTGTRNAQVTVRFYAENGTPLEVSIGAVAGTSFSYEVRTGQTLRIRTDGNGPIKSGWAEVHTTQPLAASLTFSISDLKNRLDAEVGVDKASLELETAVLADIGTGYNTAVAFVNSDKDSSNTVELILNDLEGVEQARTSVTLEPSGKRALFLTELFQQLANSSFQGVLLVRGEAPLGVLTLRQRGRHLTSLPSVRRFSPEEEPTDLYFYRLGSGAMPPLVFQTSFVVINHSDQEANIVLDLFAQDGTPLTTTVGEETTAQILRTVPPLGALFFSTRETGPIQLGWGRLRSDQSVGASAVFSLFSQEATGTGKMSFEQEDSPGVFVSEVGVEAVIPLDRFSVFADSVSTRNTAVAVSNPDETNPQNVTYSLYDIDGRFVASENSQLGPQQHEARFINEIFSEVANITEFEGRVDVATSKGIGGTLRLAGTLLTSLPTMVRLKGFKPGAEVEFHTDLGGTSPSLTFKIQQFDDDMSLDRVEVEIPEAIFDGSSLQDSQSLIVLGNTGATRSDVTVVFGYLDSVEPDGAVVISLKRLREEGSSTNLLEMGVLTLSGSNGGGFHADLQFLYRTPNSFIPDDFYFQIFLPDGLITLPEQGSSLHVAATLSSVSLSSRSDIRLVEDVHHVIDLPVYPPGVPLIVKAKPFAGRSQAPIVLEGEGLPESNGDLQAFFTGHDQNPLQADIILRDGAQLVIDTPEGTATGPLWLEANGIKGNAFKFHMLFDPAPSASLVGVEGSENLNFGAEIGQKLGELQFVFWQVRLSGVDLDLEGVTAETLVGTGKWKRRFGTTDYVLRVESVEEDSVTLALATSETAGADLRFKLSRLEGGGVLVESLPEEDPRLPVVCQEDFSIQWETTPLLRPTGGAILAKHTVSSVRTGPGEQSRYYHYRDQQLN